MQIVNIITSHVIQAHAHVLPHMEHLIVVPPLKLKNSPRSREGASFDEMRYFTIIPAQVIRHPLASPTPE